MLQLTAEEKYNRAKLFFLGVLVDNSDLIDIDVNTIEGIKISLAASEEILKWSRINCKQTKNGECHCIKTEEEKENCTFGEVLKPETINYRTMKPEKDGLFCEKIFGPSKDYECFCGKYKRMRYKGLVCDRCGVEVIQRKVRRLRMGHIKLAAPVAHIWFYRGTPSIMATLLEAKRADLESVILYQDYIVSRSKVDDVKVGTVVEEDEADNLKQKHGDDVEIGIGADALEIIFNEMNLEKMKEDIQVDISNCGDNQKIKKLRKKLSLIKAFIVSGNHPRNMILTMLPVISPDLRPLVPLDGGRFAASDLNDLYRKIINRNNRLKKLEKINAPEIIQRNEKRMLQESVDALLDNTKKRRPTRGTNNRPLKSLSDSLRGKQGRFRQNLLGKRVDYSGRSVVVVGPKLNFNECGLPKKMAIQLFEPFIIRKLKQKGFVNSIRVAKKMLEQEHSLIFDILEEVVKGHPVMLNRAPTLHRISFQAFYPVLIDDLAIHLHPLSCAAFNADFDGDQLAVHVPLTPEAILECRELMLAENNILSPANGRPVALPSQDMVLGTYYLTTMIEGLKGEGKSFSSPQDAIYAYDLQKIDLHANIKVVVSPKNMIKTTVGRLIFNRVLPEGISIFDPPFNNKTLTKRDLQDLIHLLHKKNSSQVTAKILDKIKDLGYFYSTQGGISIAIDDMIIPKSKNEAIKKGQAKVDKIMKSFEDHIITEKERYDQIIDTWTDVTESVAEDMMAEMKNDRKGLNPIYIMARSGARGSEQQIRQLAAMRGLMQKPLKKLTGGVGEIVETPIESNFREGLRVIEYFISTHGARKGLADTALKTADAGYLTRRLVDVTQDLIINEIDCHTEEGIDVSAIVEEDRHGIKIIEDIDQRVYGRYAADNIFNPTTNEILVSKGDLITEEVAQSVKTSGVEHVMIRSVLTCRSKFGICAKCYGIDLTTGTEVKLGTPAGIMAAQSIGEPGTQLTLRTFHIGGTVSSVKKGGIYSAKEDGWINIPKDFNDKLYEIPAHLSKYIHLTNVPYNENSRQFVYIDSETLFIKLYSKENTVIQDFPIRNGMVLFVENKNKVKAGETIAAWDTNNEFKFHTENGGKLVLEDVIPGINFDLLKRRLTKTEPAEFGGLDIAIPQGKGKVNKHLNCLLHLILINKLLTKNHQGILLLEKYFEKDDRSFFRLIEKDKAKGFKSLQKIRDYIGSNRIVTDLEKWTSLKDIQKYIQQTRKALEEHKPKAIIRNERQFYRYITFKRALDNIEAAFSEEGLKSVDVQEIVFSFMLGWSYQIAHNLESTGVSLESSIKDLWSILTKKKDVKPAAVQELLKTINGRIELLKKNLKFIAPLKKQKDVYEELSKLAETLKDELKILTDKIAPLTRVDGIPPKELIPEDIKTLSRDTKKILQSLLKVLRTHKANKHFLHQNSHMPFKRNPFDPKIKIIEPDKSVVTYHLQENYVLEGYFENMDNYEQFESFLHPVVEYQKPVPLYKLNRRKFVVKDITGGLPRVQEVFEARQPKEPAFLAPCNGIVKEISSDEKHNYIIEIINTDLSNEETEILKIPEKRQIFIKEGDAVKLSQPITEGAISPQDYLRLKGKIAAQGFLLNEVQEVYRIQGVNINDKHIECIVRQMFNKYRIVDPGDTQFMTGQKVNELTFRQVNEIMKEQGKNIAIAEPMLLGITKASLETDSFLSAASFQETTRVLSEAAVRGKTDLLMGLKENIIIGRLIPAGTGFPLYRKAKIKIDVRKVLGGHEEPEKTEEDEAKEMLAFPESEQEINIKNLNVFDNE